MAIQDDMLQGAAIWTVPSILPWEHSERSTDTTSVALATVDPSQPLFLSPSAAAQVLYYAQRDRQLSYRDLVLATYATLVSYAATTVWNSALPKLGVPAPVIYSSVSTPQGLLPGLPNLPQDQPVTAPATPSPVTFIPARGTPASEVAADQSLYARDLVLCEALARTAMALAPQYRPLISLDTAWTIDNQWSFSNGVYARADVGLQLPFNRNTFAAPDLALAARDNALASIIAQINLLLRNPYEHARRLYLRTVGTDAREPESYVLVSETPAQRVFAAEPFFLSASQGLKLVYDRRNGTVRWTGENSTDTHPARRVAWGLGIDNGPDPLTFATTPGTQAQVLREAPQLYDPTLGYGFDVQQLRQKSLRFCFQDARYESQFWSAFDISQGTTILGDATNPAVVQALTTYEAGLTVAPGGFAYPGPNDTAFITGTLPTGNWRVTFMLRPWAIGNSNSGAVGGASACAGPCGSNPGLSLPCDVANDPAIMLTATFGGVSATATASFQAGRTEAVSFDFHLSAPVAAPALALVLNSTLASVLALEVVQADVAMYLDAVNPLDASTKADLNGWNLELLGRAEEHLQSLYRKVWQYPLVPESRFVQVQAGQPFSGVALDFNHPAQFGYLGNGTSVIFTPTVAVGTKLVFIGNAGQLPRVRTVVSVLQAGQAGYLGSQCSATLDSALGDTDESGRVFVYGTAAFTATGLPEDLAVDANTGIVSGTVRASLSAAPYAAQIYVTVGGVTYFQHLFFTVLSAQVTAPHQSVPFLWNGSSTEFWMGNLEGVEPRLRTTLRENEESDAKAFRIGKPGDVGILPALVPEGLALDDSGDIVAYYPPRAAQPVLRTFQSWMLEAGVYVAQNDWYGEVTPVNFNPPNLPPEVSAEAPTQVTLGGDGTGTIPLSGEVTDDGLPYGSTLTYGWTQTSGPAATLADAGALQTVAAITEKGQYVFTLTASDGQLTGSASTQTKAVSVGSFLRPTSFQDPAQFPEITLDDVQPDKIQMQSDSPLHLQVQFGQFAVQEDLYGAPFALMMVLDQTGSIGNNGAQRGVDIIDSYGSGLVAIGWVSFGDIICQQKAMTTDVAGARAELASYAAGSSSNNPPFFLDGGQDEPENGVDALWAADQLVRSSYLPAPAGVSLYLHLVTDVSSFAHNVHHADDVRASVSDGTYDRVYMETGTGDLLAESDPQYVADIGSATQPTGTLEPPSVDTDRLYADHFATGAGGTSYIQHINYNSDIVTPDTLSLTSTFPAFSRLGGGSVVEPDTFALNYTFNLFNVNYEIVAPNSVYLQGNFPSFSVGAEDVFPDTAYLQGNFPLFDVGSRDITVYGIQLQADFPSVNVGAEDVTTNSFGLQGNFPLVNVGAEDMQTYTMDLQSNFPYVNVGSYDIDPYSVPLYDQFPLINVGAEDITTSSIYLQGDFPQFSVGAEDITFYSSGLSENFGYPTLSTS